MHANRPRYPHRCRTSIAAVIAAASIAATGAAAEEPATKSPDAPPPAVGLDQLLKLPDSYGAAGERRGGATAEEWRTRYRQERSELAEAEAALNEAKGEMAKLAGDTGNYQVSAPGAQTTEASPVSFKLREKIRSLRTVVEDRERALRSLEVQANLAEVPETWRE